MVDIFLYITLGIFLIGVALMFLGIITFVKSRYPVNGRLGLTTFYLIMAAVCFYTSLGLGRIYMDWGFYSDDDRS